MHIITKEGQIYLHSPKLETQLKDNDVEFSVVDTSIFPDIEWEFISALNLDYVYEYVTKKSAERNS